MEWPSFAHPAERPTWRAEFQSNKQRGSLMCSPFCGLKKKEKKWHVDGYADKLQSCPHLDDIPWPCSVQSPGSVRMGKYWDVLQYSEPTCGHTQTSTAYINQIQPHTGLYKQKYGQQVKGSGCSPVLSTYVAASGALWFTFDPQHSSDKNKSAARPAADYCNA